MSNNVTYSAMAALALLSALLYLVAAWRQLLHLERRQDRLETATASVGLVAVSSHLIVAGMSVLTGELNLGIYRVTSLIALLMSTISLLALIRRPLHTLTIAVFPLSGMAVLISTFAPATGRPLTGLDEGLLWHVGLSLTGFAVLTLAMVQGGIALLQGGLLRRHRTRGLVRWLPALDLSEAMFFELLNAGFILLSGAILAGALFIDDLFAQHLVHKTVLTGLGWLVFGLIVIVNWRSGWRIATAVKLGAAGYALIALGFFGSKLVLELVIGTP